MTRSFKPKLYQCKECKEKYVKRNSTQKVCSWKCAILYAEKDTKKKQREEQRKWNVKKAEILDKLKSKSDHEADLQRIINKIARLIDRGSNCMMCDKELVTQGKSFRENGCHYHSRGANPTLRFNLFNIWIGCHSCNGEKGGNITGYDTELIKLYGKEKWEYIKFDLVRETKPLHLTIDEIKEAKVKAMKIRNDLIELDQVFTPANRWLLRAKYNKIIGIN